jgi:linearmycin/streptolysin S transport system permease protein
MSMTALLAMVRKDLRLFFSDRRAVIVAFAVPIFIGSFIGSITGGAGRNNGRPRVNVAIADEDGSALSNAIVANAMADPGLNVTAVNAVVAKDRVRKGESAVAVVIPAGFGDGSMQALTRRSETRPQLSIFYDPSRQIELQLVQGVMTGHIVGAITTALNLPRPSPPFTVQTEALTSRENVPYNGYAHSFAGMGIQFLLFSALNLGIEMLVEREKGLWARLRSAPVSRFLIVGGKIASISIICLMTLLVSFGFAMLVFKVRIEGSLIGFAAVAISCSMMAAGFGLLVAAVGNSPKTARGVSTLASLVMVMLGGAWVPTFVFPKWLQNVTVIVPVRWAVDGLDATTWRGLGLSSAVAPTLALLAFAAVFTAIALARFRWEEA